MERDTPLAATARQRLLARSRSAVGRSRAGRAEPSPADSLEPALAGPIWTGARAADLPSALPLGEPKAVSARDDSGTRPVSLIGRVFWAVPDRDGTACRFLAESPDGSGESVTVEVRAAGYPFGRQEPIQPPDHAIRLDGWLHWAPDLDRRGAYTRLGFEAARIDLQPQPDLTRDDAARLRRRVEFIYAYHAREPRLLFHGYHYDAAARRLAFADYTAAGPGLAFVMARGLAEEPLVDTLTLDCYDHPVAGPRHRFHATFRRERLRGVHWPQAYPATLRLFADAWDQPRGLGGQDFRGLGGS